MLKGRLIVGFRAKLVVYFLCLVSLSAKAQEVGEEQRIRDSINIAKYESKLQGDTSSIAKPSFAVDSNFTFATTDTTLPKEVSTKKHKPSTAVWLSAVLPGLGQAYNRKYWKIPIIYAGFGGLGYAVYYTGSNFTLARNAYRLQVDGDSTTIGEYQGYRDPATLKAQRDFHKRNLTIAAACTVVWYCLNLIDAAVDAHLFHFDVNDKLSMQWEPQLSPPTTPNLAFGYGLKLNFTLR